MRSALRQNPSKAGPSVLDSGKPALFVLFAVIIHVLFALLFSEVTLSFKPPTAKRISLVLAPSRENQSEIVQTEAAWTSPQRLEPEFPVDETVSRLGAKLPELMQLDQPEETAFLSELSIPSVDIKDTAEKLCPRPSQELFSTLPAESKQMPIPEFALGSDFRDLSGEN